MDVLRLFSRWPQPLRSWRLLVCLLLYRVVLCLTVRTAESPDEWWQSEEVAYHMVFGAGQLTWEWHSAIRSYAFPLLFAGPLFALKWTRTDTPRLVWASSRCVQALLFFFQDCAMLALAQRLDALRTRDGGDSQARRRGREATSSAPVAETHAAGSAASVATPTIASATLAMLTVEWFLVNTGVRSYSNVAESLLFLLSLYQTSYRAFLLWAGVACAMRVTAALAVLPVFVVHTSRICRKKGLRRGLGLIFLITVGMLVGIGAAATLIDFVFYRRLVITPFRFLKFNVVMDVSKYYGLHPPYWYVVVLPALAIPFVVFLAWLPACWSWLQATEASSGAAVAPYAQSPLFSGTSSRTLRQEMKRWIFVGAAGLACHSAVGHKEMRFIYFLLPLVLMLASTVVVLLCTGAAAAARRTSAPGAPRGSWALVAPSAATVRRLFTVGWLVSAALTVALLYGYRCGGPSMFREIRRAAPHYAHLEVLTHCYATPGLAHVHGKVERLEWVDCPMELDPATGVRVVTQDRLFTEQPRAYALWRYLRAVSTLNGEGSGAAGPVGGRLDKAAWWREARRLMPEAVAPRLPDGIVLFQNTAIAVENDLLHPMGYRRVAVVFHAPYSFEPNEDRYLELWSRLPAE